MTQLAKAIVYNSKNEFLLQLRDNDPNILFPLCWNLLGGIIENNETPFQAIKRELQEEIDIQIPPPRLFCVQKHNDIYDVFFYKIRL